MQSTDSLPRVVIDLEKLRHLNTGLGRFTLHLGREMLDVATGRFDPVFFLPREAAVMFGPGAARVIPVAAWKKELVQRLVRPVLQPMVRKPRWDLWHTTHQAAKYQPFDRRTPLLLTIHDLNFLHDETGTSPRPPFQGRKRRKLAAVQRLVDRSCAIATDSAYVAEEVKAFVAVGKRPVHVVPLGLAAPSPPSPQRPAFVPEGSFLLTVGNCVPHKNFHVLIPLVKALPGVRLVVAGKKTTPYGAAIERDVAAYGIADRVVMAGEVSDADRQWLYENCKAFLFPSLAEGFGFPVLEAMQCGKPVFMSRRTSLPEIAGAEGFFFDSYEPERMAAAFRLGMQQFDEESSAMRCRRHAAQFSWRHTAERYADIYESILRQGT